MADDVNSTLREELTAAMAVLAPQIRGLHDLTTVSITDALRAEIEKQIVDRERRRDLIQAVLDRLDATNAARGALDADGYPALPGVTLPSDLFAELSVEETDLDAAIAVFEKQAPASNIAVNLGDPVEKPL